MPLDSARFRGHPSPAYDALPVTTDRTVVVAISWILLLIGLLLVRELVRVTDRPGWRPVVPFINALVVVILVAAGLAAGLGVASLASPRTGATPMPPATPVPSLAPATPTGTVSPMPPATPVPSLAPATPTGIVSPMPPATPVTSLAPAPPTDVAQASVTAGPRFRAYDVTEGRVTGYRSVEVAHRFTTPASDPVAYAFPTLSDPAGAIRLVRITTGPLAGIFLSPDDPGVEYLPGG